MPLAIDAPRTASADKCRLRPPQSAQEALIVGLVNNMPDGALAATEAQFVRLLQAAAVGLDVRLRFSCLPEVPRASVAAHDLMHRYWPIEQLLREPLDALIVTGMEPGAGPLEDEPYWDRFVRLIEFADSHTVSSIWSCLAAHAAVLHLDRVRRQRLERKCCGVFAHESCAQDGLVSGLPAPLFIPHSRWNEVPLAALRAAGYSVLSSSSVTGADTFVKRSRSLLVFFQGHPEYEPTTLLREYRRDVGRFLRGQQAHYPTQPHNYFSSTAARRLSEFEERARQAPTPELLASFPTLEAEACAHGSWGNAATQLYANWLSFIAASKRRPRAAAVAAVL